MTIGGYGYRWLVILVLNLLVLAGFAMCLRRYGLVRTDQITAALLGAFIAGLVLLGVGVSDLGSRGATVLFTIGLTLVGVMAIQEGRRQREKQEGRAAARRRTALAESLASTIADAEVRAAWPRIVSALGGFEGELLDAGRVRQLIAELERNGFVQLMEEASIGMDDNLPGMRRVALYHVGFEPNTAGCSQGPLLVELARLAAVLDSLRAERQGLLIPTRP